jgi:hypothetical protein
MRLMAAAMRELKGRLAPPLPATAPDAELAVALTRLLLDGGHGDAVGCIVIAMWRYEGQLTYEVICREPARGSVAQVLTRSLARPFHHVGVWLLSQTEALQVIGKVKGEGARANRSLAPHS